MQIQTHNNPPVDLELSQALECRDVGNKQAQLRDERDDDDAQVESVVQVAIASSIRAGHKRATGILVCQHDRAAVLSRRRPHDQAYHGEELGVAWVKGRGLRKKATKILIKIIFK